MDNKRISCDWSYSEIVNYGIQQNHVPVVRSIEIHNQSEEELRDFTVRITSEPDFAYECSKTYGHLPAGQSLNLGTINLQMSATFLANQSERLTGTLTLQVLQGDSEIYRERGSISVLAFDEWSGLAVLPELTAAFVMPNHHHIAQVVREAADILAKWTGSSSFTAYQSKDPNKVRTQAAAIYAALQNRRIAYCVAPPSFEAIGQRVRLPETIFAHRMGNCLDLSLLYAACLEAVGLHPLLVFTKGHAFAGLWLEEETFAESVQDDISVITKRISAGMNQICVVEATAFVEGETVSFDQAVVLAEKHLLDPDQFDCALDIRRARSAAVRPLPIRTATPEGWIIEQPAGTPAEQDAAAPGLVDVFEKPLEVEALAQSPRQKLWERRLLDLTLRNSLLNFRLSKSSIPVITAQLGDLEDALADGEEFQLLAKPNDWQNNGRNADLYQSIHNDHPFAQLLREEFNRKRLRVDLDALELERRMVHLYRSARVSLEENGANTLYLALGLLKWYETPVSELPRYAPIALVPVDIIRKSSRQGYVIRARDEEPQMNITLLEMLKQDYGIGIDGLDPLPRDEKGIALKQVFHVFRHALIQVPRWDIEETAYLGLFSFGQFVMWNDIRTHADKLAHNKIVASLMEGQLKWQEQPEETASLDLDHPTRLSIPISADSSQLSAIRAAGAGQSFVLHGPPGTGKSQTITNMIANALSQGKRVLFVAEKMAALSVVQRRLEQIGLGPFCLELHSNKSTKKSVLDQLAAAIEAKKIPASEAWSSQADRLFQLRSELNGYVSALHHKHPFGMTLFEAISGYEQAGEAPVVVHFNDATIEALTPDKLMVWKDLAARLQIAGAESGEPHLHPWSDSDLTTYTQALKSEADQLLKRYIPLLAHQRDALSQAAGRFKLDTANLGYLQQQILVQLCELASRAPEIKPALLQAADLEEALAQVRATAEQGRRRDQLRAKVIARFTPEVTRLDAKSVLAEWDRAELQWFLPRWSGQKRILKKLKGLAASASALSKDQVKPALVELTAWQEEESKLKEMKGKAASYLGQTWADSEEGKWEELVSACDWSEKLQALLVQWFGNRTTANSSRQQMTDVLLDGRHDQAQLTLLRSIGSLDQQIKADESELARLLSIPFEKLRTTQRAGEWLVFIADKARLWSSHIDRLREWSTWRRVRAEAVEADLQSLISPYEEGQLGNAQLIAAFERGLYRSIANYIIARDKSLLAFSGKLFEDTITRFRAADEQYLTLTQQEIAARLSAKIPQMSVEAAQSSEAGILQRAIRSGGRNLSIRKLFETIPNLLPRLTPCMLMSPISAAQYLDPNGAKFDLVIFDEASQVPTAQAVGALARGHQAVIVGDPKQLPPTSFFSKNSTETDEEEALQDMESILDDCLALGMPERHLTWHYRSRHESLIAFSNAHYYENKLMTFPSPDEPVSSVTLIPVEGYYDRGRSKQNRAEGEAVVAEMIRRVKDPVLRQRSIGVVTFSSVQQTLIEDLLEEAMKQDQELDLLFAQLPEPIFVKNLENVQGDERDVILFSVGYGPDATGKINLNFGPLNRQGGWRRLNVAVSRARHEMLVYSTLMSHHLNASRISAQGVLGLKAFLDYAEKGQRALPAGASSEQISLASNLHRSLAAELKALGYETEQQVGASGYRIDVGVLDPVNKGQYVLGILLDGPMYRDAGAARDRDILREQVLGQLGWNLVRVWSPEWWENKGNVIRQIVDAIQNAKARSHKVEPIAVPMAAIHSEPVVQVQSIAAVAEQPGKSDVLTYLPSRLEPVSLGTEMFYSPASTELILGQIRQVVREEGPISRSLLAKRVLQAWGITRLGAKLDQRLTDLIARLKPLESVSDGAVFYWPEGSEPSRYDLFRVATDEARRTAEELPAEEIAAAVKAVLASQISLPQEDLVKQVLRLLGYARSGNALDRVIRNGVQKAIELEYVQSDEQKRIVLK
ncbi:DUF3320 domain-containing protein [Paenibacillus glycanilyticus]|uniref:DUF3320 domain-containing protein n=1 Tax=Paenibacillus glycanilyticus TaxID=126569 RepID=UPI00203DF87B|nr:DUF3320 domain-containing protein [Paenibacillus glycanilyticus]MCM3631153.1 DUF3320 domain-containing protein [Paenibacillus glycanilyticus]